jgi:dTDP-4-dehydrorhamnose reductase
MGQLFGYPLQPVDLADVDGLALAFRRVRPAVVIHTGAMTAVTACARDPARAEQINVQGTRVLAELAAEARARLLLTSTDLVFDGAQGWYREQDLAAPLSVYGRTKVGAEQAVLACPGGVVARVSLLFGPGIVGRASFFDTQMLSLCQGRPCALFADEWRTPLDLLTAAQSVLAVARSDFAGVLHLGGPERLSRLEMGRRLAAFLGCEPALLTPASRTSSPEPRPRDTALDSARWRALFPRQHRPTWDEALSRAGVAGAGIRVSG